MELALLRNFLLAAAAVPALALATIAAAQTVPPAPSARQLPAGAQLPLAAGEGRAIAEKLAVKLTDNFVYADHGQRYAEMLRANAQAGRFDKGTRQELAERMTDDLQAVQRDGHLHVAVAEKEDGDHAGGAVGIPKHWPPLIQSAKWIAPGIAYIRFTAFMSTDEEVAAVRAFMREHRDAKTFIFDLRNHHGGRLGEMDEIFPYLFAEKTALVTMEMRRSIFDREGSPFGEAPTLELAKDDSYARVTHYALPGEATPARDAKVYLLTSNRTGSAAEHFSLAMKSTGRATLIGEATAGANHFGDMTEIGENFAAFVPVGRTYDIKTGRDWEGDGIAPDIAVDPRQALVVALEKAGQSHEEAVRLDATEIPAEPVHRDKKRAS
jgi:hypothetical protein